MTNNILNSFALLRQYCESEGYKGYDPYDGLNSPVFQQIQYLSKSRLARLAYIQFFKRSPINFRSIVGIKKDYNSKALGLFLSSYCKLYLLEPNPVHLEKIDFFSDLILHSVSSGYSGACWGYNFDWQARAFFQPKYTPTVVASVFVAESLLDAYAITKEKRLLETARSTCDFILNDLNRNYDSDGNFAFSYSKLDQSIVFNASLLGSRLLARVFYYTQEAILKEEANKSVAYCCNHQKENGQWPYGIYDFHQWVDSFHTGYNLECLHSYSQHTNDFRYQPFLEKGFHYYINSFFTGEGIPKYYNNSTYPIDIHAPAQLVITLFKLNRIPAHRDLLDKVLNWTIQNMQGEKGYFYYQINKYFTSKIAYMRWSQSWMFYALSTYLYYDRSLNSN
jgi:rhamnogalacturonyl hydrolase YesR